jgi:hypothetical protein
MPPRTSKKKTSQRDRLMGRTRPSDTYHLPVGDDAEMRAAADAVEAAQEALGTARMRFDDRAVEAVTEAEAALAQANEALAGLYEPIVIRAMKPEEFELLVAEHPAREGKNEAWNKDTFPRQLFLSSVVGELSREDWEEFLTEQCSEGERNGLQLTAQVVNARIPDGTIPKG